MLGCFGGISFQESTKKRKAKKNMILAKTLVALVCVAAAAFCGASEAQNIKPKLKVAADGFPSGHDTPEGVASDLERAFIRNDVALFSETCIGLYSGGGPAQYDEFMRKRIDSIKLEAARKEPSPTWPEAVDKVFAARHLSTSGPASYGYSAFGFQDVMFVDVIVRLRNGSRVLHRTLVIQEKDNKWYAHPAPKVSPLLSNGLGRESPSAADFSEAYDVQK